MQFRVFRTTDGPYGPDTQGGAASTWDLGEEQTAQVLDAARYWAEVIKVVPGQNPAIINVGTYGDHGASAGSPTSTEQPGSGTLVHAAITNSKMGDLINGAHGFINVGKMDWAPSPFIPSQLPLTPKVDITTVLIHEVAHALGVNAKTETYSVFDDYGNKLGEGIEFPSPMDAWSSHLRDENGKAAAADQYIWCKLCLTPPEDEDAFDARNDQAYFAGTYVNSVLAGAMPGIRVRTGMDLAPVNDEPVFSHSELKNSMMSHQNYRNYTTFMEAELAMLQDIGYTIDRRNFFGRSVYNDGLTLINDNPFFARNADGTDYVANTFNGATLGLGLHVYGSGNTIYQRADLLSDGAGGGGIRVDGAGNKVTILPGTRVFADGAYGRGVMFAYGKDHAFTQRGDVEALGENGIGVSFDFGHNSLGDDNEYRGSYFVELNEYNRQYIQDNFPDYYANAVGEVSGPLVRTFDLNGRVAGRYAAIYMSGSAYVGQINVMQGATITGDIISQYTEKDDNNVLRVTDLNFGLKADSEGHSTGRADPNFRLSYDSNIIGDNLSLQIVGGNTQLTGNHRLYDVAVARSAVLSGKGVYLIDPKQRFHNAGFVSPSIPGTAITIDGDYIQSESGSLQLAFNDRKVISSLVVDGHAQIGGTIVFAPAKGWYQNRFQITSDKWLTTASINGSFDTVATSLVSPTLTANAFSNGDNSYTVSLTRTSNAYAQYGIGVNSRNVGGALDRAADNAGPGPYELIAAFDFSPADGSVVRAALPQLSPEPYASAVGVLVNTSSVTRSAVTNRLQQASGGTPVASVLEMGFAPVTKNNAYSAISAAPALPAVSKDDLTRYTAWGTAFGNWSSQTADGNAARTKSTLGGFTTGIDAAVYDNWRLGVMAGYSRSTFNVADRGSSGASENYTIGIYNGAQWAASGGAIALRTGLFYTWHSVEMSRAIVFAGFNDNLTADYNAGTVQAFGEVGYMLNIAPRSTIEPYANLAYVEVKTDGFNESGHQGAALSVQSGSMDTKLSTLGLRASTSFELNGFASTTRVDFGWRHAFGSVFPTSTASFAAGSLPFTATGNAIGRDTAFIETGFDVQLNKSTSLGIAYQGQFGSRLTQNAVNANIRVTF
ncbi:autotransporter domain-containing protein [Brucella intermedia]|uniref:autotransporter family protein n=1 Tax=Brucella intermedia TaxID=94625 RepID=UPI002361AF23|nr:autotransporter outer membrane beta-barrel domain-containing protein [Brucella intermedia]